MDIMQLVQQGANLLGVDNQKANQAASQAIQKAQGIQTKNDALNAMSNAGMDSSFIDSALSALDTPKAKKLTAMASMFGVNVNQVKSQLNELKSATPNNTLNTTSITTNNNSDPLSSLKSGLKRLK